MSTLPALPGTTLLLVLLLGSCGGPGPATTAAPPDSAKAAPRYRLETTDEVTYPAGGAPVHTQHTEIRKETVVTLPSGQTVTTSVPVAAADTLVPAGPPATGNRPGPDSPRQ